MVCHHTFKDKDGNWLYPWEVIENPRDNFIHQRTQETIVRGRSEKMSKSKKNVVEPINIVKSYGADTARLFMLSDTPASRDLDWSESGIDGAWRYVNRLWKLVANFVKNYPQSSEFNQIIFDEKDLKNLNNNQIEMIKATHRCIFFVEDELNKMCFNRGIAKIREFSNALEKFSINSQIDQQIMRFCLRILSQLISPFMPHLSEELWLTLGHNGLVSLTKFPNHDKNLLQDSVVSIAIQVCGKLRGVIEISKGLNQDDLKKIVLSQENVQKFIEGKEIKKIIVVADKLVNIVV